MQRSKAKVPEELNIENWRAFAPKVKGAVIWFEAATARVRASYSTPSSRLTRSQPTGKFSTHQCVLWCLRWQWQQHLQHAHEACPFKDLAKEPGPWPGAEAA